MVNTGVVHIPAPYGHGGYLSSAISPKLKTDNCSYRRPVIKKQPAPTDELLCICKQTRFFLDMDGVKTVIINASQDQRHHRFPRQVAGSPRVYSRTKFKKSRLHCESHAVAF